MSRPAAQHQIRPPSTRASGDTTTASADPAATRILSRSTIFAGKKYAYENVVLRADDGSELHRQMVRHPGAVTILPLLDTPDGRRVVIINNERFAVARTLVELPAGTLEPNEDPSVSAVRELEEEIGYTSDDLRPLGPFYTTPGLTDEIMHTYAALNLRFVGQRLEADEKITVQIITPDEAFAMIDDGRMMDAKSMLALLLARRKGLL
ncbi:MAG: NUDIX hydrolase [Phycisphaerales bacterium]|nr:NUDIX hydrolase [Phycisphaerales bacterium]